MKLFKSILFSFALFFSAQAFADMMCVITPAHDNPFFKAEADIAEETGKIYAIIQNRRYNPQIRRLRSFLDSGVIGKITTIPVKSCLASI